MKVKICKLCGEECPGIICDECEEGQPNIALPIKDRSSKKKDRRKMRQDKDY